MDIVYKYCMSFNSNLITICAMIIPFVLKFKSSNTERILQIATALQPIGQMTGFHF